MDRGSFSETGTELSEFEEAVLGDVWRKMRRLKPHLYPVLRAWVDAVELRDEPRQDGTWVYRGFYAEQARRLGITANAVKARLKTAIRWFAQRLDVETRSRRS